jgi:hypothetical protein
MGFDCDCEDCASVSTGTKFYILLQDDDSRVEITKNSRGEGDDATWQELLLNFRNLLSAKGYCWGEENEDYFRELINGGIDGEIY